MSRHISVSELADCEIAPNISISAQQHQLLYLLTVDGLTHEAAARKSGYASKLSVQAFLRTPKGIQGLAWCVRTYLPQVGILGLHTMIALAKGAKSETVRQLAAADLMNRAGLTAPTSPDARASVSGEGLHISISLTSTEPAPVTIEHKPDA